MTEPNWKPRSGAIDVAVIDEVAVVTMNRPEKLNALTADMRQDIAAAVRCFGDGSRARGIVLTGAGRAFSAGEDLSAVVEDAGGDIEAAIELFHDITRAVLSTRVPTVAALNGLAVGGAAEMTLCFDARLGSPEAEIFMPENAIGLTISNASSYLLFRLMRAPDALRLVLDSQRIDGRTAIALGLLDEIVDDQSVVDAAISLVRRWDKPGSATMAHLELLRPPLDDVEAAFRRETAAGRAMWRSGAMETGIRRVWGSTAGDGRA